MGGILGGGSGSSQVVQKSEPPAYLQPYLTDLAARAQTALKAYSPTPYAGPRTAGPTAADNQSLSTAQQIAQQMGGNSSLTMGNANQLQTKLNSGGFQAPANEAFTPMSNDHLSSAISANIRPLLQQYQEQTMPGLTSQAIEKGAYGGGRASVVQGQANRDFQQNIGDIASKMLYQNEATNEQLGFQDLQNRRNAGIQGNQQELAATSLVPQLRSSAEQQGLDVANIYGNVGSAQRGFSSADIAAAMQAFQEKQQAPFGGLGTYSGLLGSSYIPGTGQTSVPGAGGMGNFAAGALGLANGMGGLAGLGGLFNSGAAAATGLPWLASGAGAAGMGNSLLALGSLLL